MSIIWNLSSICRFCHSDGNFRSFTLPDIIDGKFESYKDMLLKTFNISMSMPAAINASNMICDNCISSLTDAANFKGQVQACENKFQLYVKNEYFTLAPEIRDIDSPVESVALASDVRSEPPVLKIEGNETDTNPINIKSEVEYDKSSLVKTEKAVILECDNKLYIENNNFDENYTPEDDIVNSDNIFFPQAKNNADKKELKETTYKNLKIKKIKKIAIDKYSKVRNSMTCRICFKNISRVELRKHLEIHKRPYNCKFCNQNFDKYDSISLHIHKEHSRNIYICNFCKQLCMTEKLLLSHLDKHTRQNIFKCDICQRNMKDRSIMIKHIKTHDPNRIDKRFECPQCEWKFANSTNLSNHIKTVHEHIKNYHCTHCPRSFAAKKNYHKHLAVHSTKRPYECDICQKKFRLKDYLHKHKRSHHEVSKEKSYRCSNCNIKFDHRGLYIDHLQKHPEKSFICDQCGMLLSCQKSLNRHKLTHAPPQFICDLCNNMYKVKLQLLKHIQRVHLKIFCKLKCEVCGKLVVNLKQHQMTHNDRRFACTMCDKAFTERNTLKRHLRDVHSAYKLYGCEICGKRYINKKSLSTHTMKCRNK